MLRSLGPLNRFELDARCDIDATPLITTLLDERRVIEVVIAAETRLAAAEDASRVRDALGAALPRGLPGVFTDPVEDPARRSGHAIRPHARALRDRRRRSSVSGYRVDRVRPVLERLAAAGRVVRGEFRPEGTEREWCDSDVLRQLRRRSLAALRREIEPVEPEALVRFLPHWQGVGVPRRGLDGLVEVIGILQGAAIPGVGIRERRAAGATSGLPGRRSRCVVHRRRSRVDR